MHNNSEDAAMNHSHRIPCYRLCVKPLISPFISYSGYTKPFLARLAKIGSSHRRRVSDTASYKRPDHDEPLRILFCGADRFSLVSLEALVKESQLPSSNIASIDVICRAPKPSGRGLKILRDRMCPCTMDVDPITDSSSLHQEACHGTRRACPPN